MKTQKTTERIATQFCVSLLLIAPLLANAGGRDMGSDYQIYNFSRYGDSVGEFSIKEINASEISQYAPPEVIKNIDATSSRGLFLLSAPTQNTAGYSFEISRRKNKLTACLRKPSKDRIVLMALTNPGAVLIIQKDLKVFLSKDYCPQ